VAITSLKRGSCDAPPAGGRIVPIGFTRHAGLVPASTVPHTHRPLASRHGGPRDEPGVTRVERSTAISAWVFSGWSR